MPPRKMNRRGKLRTRIEKAYGLMNADFFPGVSDVSFYNQARELFEKRHLEIKKKKLRFTPLAHVEHYSNTGSRVGWSDLTPPQRERIATKLIQAVNPDNHSTKDQVISRLYAEKELIEMRCEEAGNDAVTSSKVGTQYLWGWERLEKMQRLITIYQAVIHEIRIGKRAWKIPVRPKKK